MKPWSFLSAADFLKIFAARQLRTLYANIAIKFPQSWKVRDYRGANWIWKLVMLKYDLLNWCIYRKIMLHIIAQNNIMTLNNRYIYVYKVKFALYMQYYIC